MGRLGRHGDTTLMTVTATGTVKGEWETVGFRLTASETAKTGPKAKQAVKPSAHLVEDAITALRAAGVDIDQADVVATYNVVKIHSYDHEKRQNVHGGYTCNYACSFTTKSVDKASDIHDALTSLGDKIECNDPEFAMAKEGSLRQQALESAWKGVMAERDRLCAVSGIKAELLVETAISTGHDHATRGESRAMVAGAGVSMRDAEPIKLSAGKPEVSVTLSVSYERI